MLLSMACLLYLANTSKTGWTGRLVQHGNNSNKMELFHINNAREISCRPLTTNLIIYWLKVLFINTFEYRIPNADQRFEKC